MPKVRAPMPNGKRFGALTIVKYIGKTYTRQKIYVVRCSCGNLETRTDNVLRTKPNTFWQVCKRCRKVFNNVKLSTVTNMEERTGKETVCKS